MDLKVLATHSFNLSPKTNGGEALTITTKFFDNGDEKTWLGKRIFTNQELTLQSYCNSASIQLCGSPLTPDILRKLANELDQRMVEVKAQIHFETAFKQQINGIKRTRK